MIKIIKMINRVIYKIIELLYNIKLILLLMFKFILFIKIIEMYNRHNVTINRSFFCYKNV